MDWIMANIYWVIALSVFLPAVAVNCIFRVPDVHVGLPSSLLRGRFKKDLDDQGFSVPIHRPYKEGFHFKPPWWSVAYFSREVVTRKIPPKEFQVKGSANCNKKVIGGRGGGSVTINITIQFRPSEDCLYRFVEVDVSALHAGLDAEIEYEIGKKLGEIIDYEEAVTLRPVLSATIYRRFNNPVIEKDENGDIKINGKHRFIGEREISYAEHNYGIEILKVSIDSIELPKELNDARQAEQKEIYQRESETTEWVHLLGRMKQLKKLLPGLKEEEILRAVQVWQKQFPMEFREIKIDSTEGLSTIAAAVAGLFGKSLDNKPSKPEIKEETKGKKK